MKWRVLDPQAAVSQSRQEAKELVTSATMRRFSGLGSLQSKDKYEIAYEKYIRLGEIKKACEALVKIGKWEKALSLAPGDSINYWRDLSTRYVEHLDDMENKSVLDHHVALGDLKGAQNYLVSEGSWRDAIMLSTAWCSTRSRDPGHVGVAADFDDTREESQKDDIRRLVYPMAKYYKSREEPLLAGATYLGVGDIDMAIEVLLEFEEVFAAFLVAVAFVDEIQESDASMEMYKRAIEIFASKFTNGKGKSAFGGAVLEIHVEQQDLSYNHQGASKK